MELKMRAVKENEKGCRICKEFKANRICWQHEMNHGKDCKFFNRDYDIKEVMD